MSAASDIETAEEKAAAAEALEVKKTAKRDRTWRRLFMLYGRDDGSEGLQVLPRSERLPSSILSHISIGIARSMKAEEIAETLGVRSELIAYYMEKERWCDEMEEMVEEATRRHVGGELQHAVFSSQLIAEAEAAIRRGLNQRDDPALAVRVAEAVLAANDRKFGVDPAKDAAAAQSNMQINFYAQERVQGAIGEAVKLVEGQAEQMKSLMPGVLDIPESPHISVSSKGDGKPVVDLLKDVPRRSVPTLASDGVDLDPAPEIDTG